MEGAKKHQFTGFQMPHEMLLLTNREQREVTLSEVKEIGASVQRKAELHPLGVLVFSKEVTPFTKLRTYRNYCSLFTQMKESLQCRTGRQNYYGIRISMHF